MKIGVIDYGAGNIASVFQAIEKLKYNPTLLKNPNEMNKSDRLILPGVGNFSDCARLLDTGGWSSALRDQVFGNEKPLLGICIGMQLLSDNSTEGFINGNLSLGLGFIPGDVRHLSDLGCTQRIPHVGWNNISYTSNNEILFNGIPENTDFYFVHSYAFIPKNPSNLLATVDCGIPVTAAVRSAHVWGTQFHPEKSSRAGLRLLKNFIEGPTC